MNREAQIRMRILLLPLVLAALAGCATTAARTSPDMVTELVEARTTDGVRLEGALWSMTFTSGLCTSPEPEDTPPIIW